MNGLYVFPRVVLSTVVLALLAAAPAHANSISVFSSLSDSAAVASSDTDPTLTTGPSNSLVFSTGLLSSYTGGSWISVTGAPAGTQSVSLGGGNPQNSGFVEVTFTLPSNFSNASIAGQASTDELGYIFLNGNLIGQAGQPDPNTITVNEPNDATYSSNDQAFFLSGVNTLVISDINTSGPGGVEFYGNINYTSPVPEPSSILLLSSGLAGLAGMVRRRIARKA